MFLVLVMYLWISEITLFFRDRGYLYKRPALKKRRRYILIGTCPVMALDARQSVAGCISGHTPTTPPYFNRMNRHRGLYRAFVIIYRGGSFTYEQHPRECGNMIGAGYGPPVCREHRNGRCMEAAAGNSPYCRKHRFEHYNRGKKLNRARGLCACGNKRIDGYTARGKRYTTCSTCLAKHRAYHGGRLAEIKALPGDIRRYAGNGRYAGYRDLALSLHRAEQDRRDKAIEAAQAVLPKLDNRKRLFIQKYVELGASWGAGERAAIMAGYGKISASQGGRSAAVRACNLLKRADIQKAIREYRDMLYRSEQLRLAAEKRADARAMINTLVDNLKMHVLAEHPQSRIAQTLRRLQGQPVKRVPGYCVCGDVVTEGYASCEPCRVRHRHYRQAERAAKRCTLPSTYLPEYPLS